MITVAIIDKEITPTSLDALLENKTKIKEVIAPFEIKELSSKLIAYNNNEAVMRNEVVKESSSDYIFWMNGTTVLEEETLDEFLEVAEDADIIYPNVVIDGKIKNFTDWHKKEFNLLQTLQIEKELPYWGVMTKKEIEFDEKYGPITFWAYVMKNLDKLTLKLSDASFIDLEPLDLLDTSYLSLLIREIAKKYDFQLLFSALDWRDEAQARAVGFTLLGNRLKELNDNYNASTYFRQALFELHNQHSAKLLIDTYIDMGLFEDAKKIANTQLDNEDEIKAYNQKIDSLIKLVEKLEEMAENGNFQEILQAKDDIFQTYSGAHIHNLIGATYLMFQDIPKAYEELIIAAIKNPLDQDILKNIAGLAKMINQEENVVGIYQRLTQKEEENNE